LSEVMVLFSSQSQVLK